MFKKSRKRIEKKIIPQETDEALAELQIGNSDEAQEDGQLSLDVFRTKNEIIVVAPVAGVAKKDLNILINDDVLTIRGVRNFSFSVEKEKYSHQECYWGNFSRSVVLPEDIDIRHVKASFKEGILIVKIPTVERPKNRTIEINDD